MDDKKKKLIVIGIFIFVVVIFIYSVFSNPTKKDLEAYVVGQGYYNDDGGNLYYCGVYIILFSKMN